MSVQGRVGRLTALAIATGTLVAAGSGVAGASAPAGTRQLTASGQGSALHLTINLPDAVAQVLGTSKIEQYISLTDGKVSTIGLPSAETTALLGKGTTPVLSDLLNKSTSAVLNGKTEDTSNQDSALNSVPGFKVQLLPLSSKVANPATTLNGSVAKSSSAIAHISIGGLPLAQLNTVTAPVQAVLGTALGTVNGTTQQATATVTDTVNTALGALNGVTSNAASPVTSTVQSQVDAAVSTLNGALNGLTSTLTGLQADTDLLSLDAVTSDQNIVRNGDAVTSTVSNTIKNLSVLNGLVKVSAITSEASATAGGAPGTAKASTNAPVFKVDVANGALTALLDQNGLNVGGTVGSALPAEVQGAVNTALDAVNSTLNQAAGINVEMGQGATNVAPDGTSAVAKVAATRITVDPPALHGNVAGVALPVALLPADKKFLTLELVSAEAVAANQFVPATPVQLATPKALPRTGGNLPLTGAIAALFVGAAMLIRRRRTAEI
ncbi:MAG: hypothetical protein QOJ79_142 [Actinomycetota bacterium]|jgi:hypothetical protein|nr:hypothetical protein [Actinomycetota bacterium]